MCYDMLLSNNNRDIKNVVIPSILTNSTIYDTKTLFFNKFINNNKRKFLHLEKILLNIIKLYYKEKNYHGRFS